MMAKNNEILMITPAQYEATADVMRKYETGANIELFVNKREPYSIENGIAQISISGSLANGAAPVHEILGGTDYKSVIADIEKAKADGAKAIVYNINSGGGSVVGLQEAGAAIKSSGIDSVAHVEGHACSAAYYLAVNSDKVVSSPSSYSGNIGTVMAFANIDKALEAQGVERVTLTNEGADLKGIGRESMSESQLAFLQSEVDRLGADFRSVVEANRPGIDEEVFRAGWYMGEQALELGLVDGVATKAELMAELNEQFS